MSKNKKKVNAPVVKEPVVNKATETSPTPVEVASKAPEAKPEDGVKQVKTPQVEKPKVVKPEQKPQQKPRPQAVTPVIVPPIQDKSGIKASDAILLASLNQNAILHNLYGDTPELHKAVHHMAGIALATANVMFLTEMKQSGKELGIIIKDEEIASFLEGCATLGITGAKALPLKPADGQTTIDFTEAVIPEEVVKSAEEEKKALDKEAVKGIPELDPNKIETKEALVDALMHIERCH